MFNVKVTKKTTKEQFDKLISKCINKIVKEKKVSYDTACLVLYYSDWYRETLYKWRKLQLKGGK